MLIEYLYGELDDATRADVKATLARCPDCRDELARLQRVHAAFGQLGDVEVPHRLHADIVRHARLHAAGAAPRRSRWAALFATPAFGLALSVVLLVAGGFVFVRLVYVDSAGDAVSVQTATTVATRTEADDREVQHPTPDRVPAAPSETPAPEELEPGVEAAPTGPELAEPTPTPTSADAPAGAVGTRGASVSRGGAGAGVATGGSEVRLRSSREARPDEAFGALGGREVSQEPQAGIAREDDLAGNLGREPETDGTEGLGDVPFDAAGGAAAPAARPAPMAAAAPPPEQVGSVSSSGREESTDRHAPSAERTVAEGRAAAAVPESEAQGYGTLADADDEAPSAESAAAEEIAVAGPQVNAQDGTTATLDEANRYYDAGDYRQAASRFDAFLAAASADDPRRPAALYDAATANLRIGRDDIALALLRRFLASYPSHELAAAARVLVEDTERRQAETEPTRQRTAPALDAVEDE